MSDTDAQVPLPDLNAADAPSIDDVAYHDDEQAARVAADLEAVFDVPVQVSAVLGRSKMKVLRTILGHLRLLVRLTALRLMGPTSLPHIPAPPSSAEEADVEQLTL